MKRIANKVALRSILYGVKGNQEIKVLDYNTVADIAFDDENYSKGTVVYSGMASNLSLTNNYRIVASEFKLLEIKDNVMIFKICMNSEEY